MKSQFAKPRIETVTTGVRRDGSMYSRGFQQNVEFLTITYEAPLNVATHHAFARIAPMLWLRAGATGRRIDDLEKGWDVADAYGVIADLDHLEDFLEAINSGDQVTIAYIVTDDDRQFAATCSAIPEHIEPVRLYESYLRNFQIDARRSSR